MFTLFLDVLNTLFYKHIFYCPLSFIFTERFVNNSYQKNVYILQKIY